MVVHQNSMSLNMRWTAWRARRDISDTPGYARRLVAVLPWMRVQVLENEQWQLPGAIAHVWVIVSEVLLVVVLAIIAVLIWPPSFNVALPRALSIIEHDPPLWQACAAVFGATVVVALFTALFACLTLLYVHRRDTPLYALHSLWIGSFLGVPLTLWLLAPSAGKAQSMHPNPQRMTDRPPQ